MRLKRSITGVISFLLAGCLLYGQDDSLRVELPAVEINAAQVSDFIPGLETKKPDSMLFVLHPVNSIGEILTRSGMASTGNYYFNGLTLLSLRGLGTSRSAVYWLGFPIDPANNGMFDLSMIPASFFPESGLEAGGNSSLSGSGAIGGSLNLKGSPSFYTPFRAEIGLMAGSFDNAGSVVTLHGGNRRIAYKSGLIFRKGTNDFSYTDPWGHQQKNRNAGIKQSGFIQELRMSLGRDSELAAGIWWNDHHRGVPPSTTSTDNDAWQYDRGLKTIVRYELRRQKYTWYSGLAYFDDIFRYGDPSPVAGLIIDSRIATRRTAFQSAYTRQLKHGQKIRFGIVAEKNSGRSNNYTGDISEQQAGLQASWTFPAFVQNWKGEVNLRQDFHSAFQVPFSPSVGLSGPVSEHISLRFHFSRNYRIPNLNDRYWVPGGNEDLRPEYSWNAETGAIYRLQTERYLIKIRATLFSALVSRWIQWIPNGAIWYPENVRKVWARGWETGISVATGFGKHDLLFSADWYKNRVTTLETTSSLIPTGLQLPYTPADRIHLHLGWNYSRMGVSWDSYFTGLRYTTQDHTATLPAYTVSNLSVIWSSGLKPVPATLALTMNNIFNIEYEVVKYYPTPGRWFEFSVKVIIKSKKSK
ncbi:MAG: TonB-dependent receptor [Bacteroidales bacterium]